MTTTYALFPTVLGTLRVAGTGLWTTHLFLRPTPDNLPQGWIRDDRAHAEARGQITAYLAGALQHLELDLAPAGTDFQHRVWSRVRDIPYGQTRTYGQLARQIGQPGAARAVGMALAQNPLPLFIPCHRVLDARGLLTGFGPGLDLKRRLLDLEQGQQSLFPWRHAALA